MDLHINLWAVLLAGVSSMLIGAIYYSPQLFGNAWIKLAGVDEKRYKKETPKLMLPVFVVALVTAYFVAFFSFLYHDFFQDSWLAASVVTSLLVWVGFSATTVYVHGLLEQKRKKLMAITMGNRLLTLLAMGLILGWLHP